MRATFNEVYYFFKPIIPRYLQLLIRRKIVSSKMKKFASVWPIDPNSAATPRNWPGWPKNKKFALILTHDVDSQKGFDNCIKLLHIEKELGFRSSFNFVPKKYYVNENIICEITNNGYEIGVHGLYHDGKLFKNKKIFSERAQEINKYLKSWKAVGFRSPSMHHNLEWIHDLNIEYDSSTFDTDPFEPQPDGVGTIFPFWVSNFEKKSTYLELPYTLCQDFTLFILMQMIDINIWIKKADWIVNKNGMVLLNTHPDYMNFSNIDNGSEEYSVSLYRDFLFYIKNKYQSLYWNPLPKEVVQFLKDSMNY